MRKAVIDTNVIVSAALNRNGIPGQVVSKMQHDYRCVLSSPVYAEYVEVLHREKIGLPGNVVRGILSLIRRHGDYCNPQSQPERTSDPDDQPFWDLAVTADAALVTGNVKDFPDSPRVRTPRQFHDALQQAS